MTWNLIPSFERLPITRLIDRNPEQRAAILEAIGKAAADAMVSGLWGKADRSTRIELLREAIRPFDMYAHQRGELQ